jgi:hypothetical protein
MPFGVMCKVCGWPKQVGDRAEGVAEELHPDAVAHKEDCICDRLKRPTPVDEMLMEQSKGEE